MIIEGLNKVDRKEFKAMLSKVDGIMLRTHSIKGYNEPKNIEVVFICLNLEQSIDAHAKVKSALAEVRSNSNARFLA